MKKKLMASAITIVMLISLMVTATFALFTSSVNLSGNTVRAGKVNLTASLTFKKAESSLGAVSTDIKEGDTVVGNTLDGERTIAVRNNNRIEMDNILPGDKGTFELSFENKSTVAISYKYLVVPTTDSGLYSGLNIQGITFTQAGSISAAPWVKDLLPEPEDKKNPESVEFTIELPVSAGNSYQDTSFGFDILVFAVQNNGTEGVVFANSIETINAAKEGNSVILTSNITSIDAITINTSANIDLNGHTIEGKSITIGNDTLTKTVCIENGKLKSVGTGSTDTVTISYPNATVTVAETAVVTSAAANPVIQASPNTFILGENVTFEYFYKNTAGEEVLKPSAVIVKGQTKVEFDANFNASSKDIQVVLAMDSGSSGVKVINNSSKTTVVVAVPQNYSERVEVESKIEAASDIILVQADVTATVTAGTTVRHDIAITETDIVAQTVEITENGSESVAEQKIEEYTNPDYKLTVSGLAFADLTSAAGTNVDLSDYVVGTLTATELLDSTKKETLSLSDSRVACKVNTVPIKVDGVYALEVTITFEGSSTIKGYITNGFTCIADDAVANKTAVDLINNTFKHVAEGETEIVKLIVFTKGNYEVSLLDTNYPSIIFGNDSTIKMSSTTTVTTNAVFRRETTIIGINFSADNTIAMEGVVKFVTNTSTNISKVYLRDVGIKGNENGQKQHALNINKTDLAVLDNVTAISYKGIGLTVSMGVKAIVSNSTMQGTWGSASIAWADPTTPNNADYANPSTIEFREGNTFSGVVYKDNGTRTQDAIIGLEDWLIVDEGGFGVQQYYFSNDYPVKSVTISEIKFDEEALSKAVGTDLDLAKFLIGDLSVDFSGDKVRTIRINASMCEFDSKTLMATVTLGGKTATKEVEKGYYYIDNNEELAAKFPLTSTMQMTESPLVILKEGDYSVSFMKSEFPVIIIGNNSKISFTGSVSSQTSLYLYCNATMIDLELVGLGATSQDAVIKTSRQTVNEVKINTTAIYLKNLKVTSATKHAVNIALADSVTIDNCIINCGNNTGDVAGVGLYVNSSNVLVKNSTVGAGSWGKLVSIVCDTTTQPAENSKIVIDNTSFIYAYTEDFEKGVINVENNNYEIIIEQVEGTNAITYTVIN